MMSDTVMDSIMMNIDLSEYTTQPSDLIPASVMNDIAENYYLHMESKMLDGTPSNDLFDNGKFIEILSYIFFFVYK